MNVSILPCIWNVDWIAARADVMAVSSMEYFLIVSALFFVVLEANTVARRDVIIKHNWSIMFDLYHKIKFEAFFVLQYPVLSQNHL